MKEMESVSHRPRSEKQQLFLLQPDGCLLSSFYIAQLMLILIVLMYLFYLQSTYYKRVET